MKYKAILTHNPQDYFEGAEPEDLVVTVEFERSETKAFDCILHHVDNGFVGIITPNGDDGDG